jgi:dienelactone hydrolase
MHRIGNQRHVSKGNEPIKTDVHSPYHHIHASDRRRQPDILLEGIMIKINTAHLTTGLLCLLIAVSAVSGTVMAADNGAPAPGFIGEQGGRGNLPAVAQSRADLRTHTLYRPVALPAEPLPLLIWGNGGCSDYGLSHDKFLRDIASHGYIVIALGYAWRQPPRNDPAGQEKDATDVAQMSQAMTWAAGRTADPVDELYGHIDTNLIAVAGHSCGGLQAIKISADPRVSTSMIFDSGVYNQPGGRSKIKVSKDELANLQGPIAYFTGGPSDIAHPNASNDVTRIKHVPVFFGWLPVGHGGTFSAPDGGDWAEVAVHWLDWQLKGNRSAGHWFLGEDCGLCSNERWTVERFAGP